ncbi:cysteine hydrolase family protein [Pseudomonas tolaasii]
MGYDIKIFDPIRTAVLIIDMQNDFIAVGGPLETPSGRMLIPRLNKLLDTLRKSYATIIYTAHVHKVDGSDIGRYGEIYPQIGRREALVDYSFGADIYPDCAPKSGDQLIKKHRYSAFFGTELQRILKERYIENIVVVGVTTENSVHATARDALFRDYRTFVIADCCATRDHPDAGWGALSASQVQQTSLIILKQSTAEVCTSEEFVKRFCFPTVLPT